MQRSEIIKLSKKNIDVGNIENAKKILSEGYEISYGEYSATELKKAIDEKNPVVIKDYLLTGYDADGKFVDSSENKIKIDRMVKAIIIEAEKVSGPDAAIVPGADCFAITGNNEWPDIKAFDNIIGRLKVGELFLPPHSAVFNFMVEGEKEKKEKIVSMLEGASITIYSEDNYIDNCFHEIGHLFWRSCLLFEEKKAFKDLYKQIRASAIFEYQWELGTEEEVFCTIYKWYLKSLLINKAFYNILEHEEPRGLSLLQAVFDRISKDRMTNDIFDMNREIIMDYINPRLDRTTGRYIVKKGVFDEIKDIEVPREMMNDIVGMVDGSELIELGKAIVPVKDGKIEWDSMEKAKFIRKDPDGKGGWKYTYAEPSKKKVAPTLNDFQKDIAKRHDVSLSLIQHGTDGFEVSKVVIPKDKRGEGLGSKVMDDIVKYADDSNMKILLTPSTDFGASSVPRLKAFYKKFGFVENKGKNKDYSISSSMYRENK